MVCPDCKKEGTWGKSSGKNMGKTYSTYRSPSCEEADAIKQKLELARNITRKAVITATQSRTIWH